MPLIDTQPQESHTWPLPAAFDEVSCSLLKSTPPVLLDPIPPAYSRTRVSCSLSLVIHCFLLNESHQYTYIYVILKSYHLDPTPSPCYNLNCYPLRQNLKLLVSKLSDILHLALFILYLLVFPPQLSSFSRRQDNLFIYWVFVFVFLFFFYSLPPILEYVINNGSHLRLSGSVKFPKDLDSFLECRRHSIMQDKGISKQLYIVILNIHPYLSNNLKCP